MIFRTNRCPHINVRGIYGDEIYQRGGYRNECRDCGLLLDGPVAIAVERETLRKHRVNPQDFEEES